MKIGLVLGRFQPYHLAHKAIVDYALSRYHTVAIGIGSVNVASTIKNPWDFSSRESMIMSNHAINANIRTFPMRDYWYSDAKWVNEVSRSVYDRFSDEDVCLVGTRSDSTSAYLDYFPQWEVDSPNFSQIFPKHATTIREHYFRGKRDWIDYVPEQTCMFMERFCRTAQYNELVKEQLFADKYTELWKSVPYAPTFVTVDCVVVASNHVLITKRGGFPGKGLYALPGGFVKSDESLRDAAIRELKEETAIRISKADLISSIRSERMFDYPYRSLRGRTFTMCYYINMGNNRELPEIRGGDDAFWMPLFQVERLERHFFEDHAEIIRSMVE